jgi:hypothetical protein
VLCKFNAVIVQDLMTRGNKCPNLSFLFRQRFNPRQQYQFSSPELLAFIDISSLKDVPIFRLFT